MTYREARALVSEYDEYRRNNTRYNEGRFDTFTSPPEGYYEACDIIDRVDRVAEAWMVKNAPEPVGLNPAQYQEYLSYYSTVAYLVAESLAFRRDDPSPQE